MRSLNNVTTLDDYDPSTTVDQPGAARLNLDVTGAAVLMRLGVGQSGGVVYGPDVFRPPGKYSLDRRADAAGVKSAVAGTPAQVTLELLTPEDLA